MPDDIRILHEMIKKTATIPIGRDAYQKKRQVTLDEPEEPTTGNVTITGLPDHAIVIKADKFSSPDTVFACSNGECKRADFIIVADTGKKRVILCIEMKARKTAQRNGNKYIIQQLKGAQCFIGYCREIGKSFWQSPNFLDNYEYRFINIAPNNIPRRETRVYPKMGTHDEPEKMLKVRNPKHGHLEFNQLAGKGNLT
ncbi:MAG: hypothetical protein KJO08_03440 [Gammaproteobacteria bacterium]|nr:hypothetical protein [Gammaproteobacteria bacterium]NNJ83615.1 hypothetical protein [Gammaproteobacteria bacterium]